MNVCIGPLCTLFNTILFIINVILVPVIFALAFIVFLWGIAKSYIFSRGDEDEVKKGHRLLLWGIIGFAIMISLWGLVNIVADTFNLVGTNNRAPAIPFSPTR